MYYAFLLYSVKLETSEFSETSSEEDEQSESESDEVSQKIYIVVNNSVAHQQPCSIS